MSTPLAQSLIHPAAPPAPGWWPPAPGWWLLLGLLLLLALLLPVALLAWRRLQQRRRRAMRILGAINHDLTGAEWITAINTLLKRWLKTRGQNQALLLHGQAWVDYLCSTYPSPRRDLLAPLASGGYAPDCPLDGAQRQRLLFELQRWLRHNHA